MEWGPTLIISRIFGIYYYLNAGSNPGEGMLEVASGNTQILWISAQNFLHNWILSNNFQIFSISDTWKRIFCISDFRQLYFIGF